MVGVPHLGILRQGFLDKKGVLNPSFQRRWFVLRNLSMTYYKSSQDTTAQGTIALSAASLQVLTRFEFILSVNTGRDFVLSASLEKDMRRWFCAIRRHMIDPLYIQHDVRYRDN